LNGAWAISAGLAASLVLVPLTIPVVRRLELVDVPNQRSSHRTAVPRGGGIGVALAAGIAMSAGVWSSALGGIAIGSLLVGLVGLADDFRGLTPGSRLVAEVVACCAAVPLLLANWGGSLPWQVAFAVGSIVVLVGYVNAFNFMDGINGISALHALVGGLAFALFGREVDEDAVVYAGLALAGASAGFLPFNLVRAKIFLGDVGSYFMGFWLAASFIVLVRAGVPMEVALAPLLYYLADTSVTVIRRWRRAERMTQAHREHSYQLLVAGGWSHLRTALVTTGVSAVCALLMLVVIDASAPARACAFAVCVCLVVLMTSLPFVLKRSSPRPT
jgi:UDP-GlcNAc:undecaprenyl-phosphate GlcNAc-1-phosphate transferase